MRPESMARSLDPRPVAIQLISTGGFYGAERTLLELATLAGARALGTSGVAGSLAAGKLANLAVVALPDHEAADPHELVFDSDLPVVATWHRGERVVTAGSS